MRFQLALLTAASAALASPVKRASSSSMMMSSMSTATMTGSASMPSSTSTVTNADILQYALTLEHLEATFYSQALSNFSQSDFQAAGYEPWVRERISEIMTHEMAHVDILTNALAAAGASPNAACTYDFPVSTVEEFLVFACGLENIGESAYLGALGYITEAAYIPVAGAITVVEARHQEFFYGPVLLKSGWTGPYDTPLGLDMVYTLVAPLITSCPSNNTALPVMSYGTLTVNGSAIFNAQGGETVMINYDNMGSNDTAVIYNGLGTSMVSVSNGGMVTLPSAIQGYSYIVVCNSTDMASMNSSNIVAGPAEIQTAFAPGVFNPGFMDPFNSTPNMTESS